MTALVVSDFTNSILPRAFQRYPQGQIEIPRVAWEDKKGLGNLRKLFTVNQSEWYITIWGGSECGD